MVACSADVRGKFMAKALRKMYCIKPLQSKPVGDVPPKRYATPKNPIALEIKSSTSPRLLDWGAGVSDVVGRLRELLVAVAAGAAL